jgi:hypothetical protein
VVLWGILVPKRQSKYRSTISFGKKMRCDVERHVRIGLDHNNGENRIVIFIKAGKNISDELIIVEGSSCCSEVVGILAHLGVVVCH